MTHRSSLIADDCSIALSIAPSNTERSFDLANSSNVQVPDGVQRDIQRELYEVASLLAEFDKVNKSERQERCT